MLSLSKEKRKMDVSQEVINSFKKNTSIQGLQGGLQGIQDLQGSNQVVESFNFRVQAPVSGDDPTLCWTYTIPQLRTN